MKVFVFVLLLFVLAFVVISETINPKTDLYRYEFLFTKLVDNTIPITAQHMLEMDQIRLEWTPPIETSPYNEQPDPVAYSSNLVTLAIPIQIPASIVTGTDSVMTYVYKGQLEPGEWQVQVRCSIHSTEKGEQWSKYSDSVAFFVDEPEYPPIPPASIIIRFE